MLLVLVYMKCAFSFGMVFGKKFYFKKVFLLIYSCFVYCFSGFLFYWGPSICWIIFNDGIEKIYTGFVVLMFSLWWFSCCFLSVFDCGSQEVGRVFRVHTWHTLHPITCWIFNNFLCCVVFYSSCFPVVYFTDGGIYVMEAWSLQNCIIPAIEVSQAQKR